MITKQTNIKDLKRAIETLHNCTATHKEDVMIEEHFGIDTVWEGTVSIFNLKSHPTATKCYAWSSPIEGSSKRKYYTVLNLPPIDSPEKAVRASIISDYKIKKNNNC
jgi:hypothetical protein